MKHSIRTKMTLMLTTMIIITILITWFINSAFLEKYYLMIKQDRLYDAYEEVAEIYENSADYNLTDTEISKIEKLETQYDVEVYVLNAYNKTVFPEAVNIGEREKLRTQDFEKQSLGLHNPDFTDEKVLKNEENYMIYICYDNKLASKFINFWGKIDIESKGSDTAENVTGVPGVTQTPEDNGSSEKITGVPKDSNSQSEDITGAAEDDNKSSERKNGSSENFGSDSDKITVAPGNNQGDSGSGKIKPPAVVPGGRPLNNMDENATIIILRSNIGSITESVKISNEFLAYVGIIAAIIGSIAMFILTKSFTKPILVLSGIAKKMTDLDFEVKYRIESKDEIGELGSCINSLSDKLETTITELKQANNELMTDIQRKTEIDEIRKEFLSNVSHELKTPIALIQGYAEGLKENINEDEESRDYYCEVIMDEANKMNNMVKKLLSLNELEFGNNQVNLEYFDIVALIKSVLGSTDILFKQKEVTLHFEQKEPVYVWADELLIEQVVTNYISNALNHVSGQKIIEIKLIPRGDTVRIAVFNTGNNIPEDELDKIWIKFYKVDKARTREYGGSGIGLSIVKAIMNSHNKDCGVINRNVGVEFWFELDTKS